MAQPLSFTVSDHETTGAYLNKVRTATLSPRFICLAHTLFNCSGDNLFDPNRPAPIFGPPSIF
jgi:hypothetical protein